MLRYIFNGQQVDNMGVEEFRLNTQIRYHVIGEPEHMTHVATLQEWREGLSPTAPEEPRRFIGDCTASTELEHFLSVF